MLRDTSARLLLVLLATLASASVEAPQIASFYIVTDHFSDALPGPFDVVSEERLLDVVRVDNGVRVRLIRFTWRTGCPGT
jgi:hypothetical protein